MLIFYYTTDSINDNKKDNGADNYKKGDGGSKPGDYGNESGEKVALLGYWSAICHWMKKIQKKINLQKKLSRKIRVKSSQNANVEHQKK